MPRYRPMVVDVPPKDGKPGGTFEVHLGRPGVPKVYRRGSRPGAPIRRVKDEPTLSRVAVAMREGVDRAKAAEEAEAKRKKTLRFKLFRGFGEWLARAWRSFMPK